MSHFPIWQPQLIRSCVSPQVREFELGGNPGNFWLWNAQSRKFCLWNSESRALEYGILLTFGAQNPSSTDQDGLESSTWDPESTAWNPESKTGFHH